MTGLVAAAAISGWLASPATAATSKPVGDLDPEVRVYDASGSLVRKIMAFEPSFRGGVRVALGDVDGDGVDEIIAAAGPGGQPRIRIFNDGGTLQTEFLAYGSGFRGGVSVAAYDLTGDGRSEIITGPGTGGGPDVRVFAADGTRVASFLAYDQRFRGGVNVTAGAFGPHGEPRIITATAYGGNHVRGYTMSGSYAGINLRPFPNTIHGIALARVPDAPRDQLLVSPQQSAVARVERYDLSRPSQPLRSFNAYRRTFEGGARLAAADLDGDGSSEYVVATGPGGQPRVRLFTSVGAKRTELNPYPEAFEGGVSVAASPTRMLVAPGSVVPEGRTDLFRYIQIDLSDQTLTYYQNGKRLGTHRVSTGKWTTPTPIGTFAIKNKIPVAYSKPYDLYMEWWMAFTPDGSYGLHALPYWRTSTGGKRYEGVGHLGTPVSHGCIRQSLAEAEHLFQWADIGTPVIVRR